MKLSATRNMQENFSKNRIVSFGRAAAPRHGLPRSPPGNSHCAPRPEPGRLSRALRPARRNAAAGRRDRYDVREAGWWRPAPLGPCWRAHNPALRDLVKGRWLPFRRRDGGPYRLASVSASAAGALGRPLAAILQGDWCDSSSTIGGSQAAMSRSNT